jgi:hypothetical protein
MPSNEANPNENTQSHRHIDDPDSVFKGAHKLQPSDFDEGSYTVTDSISSQEDVDIWRVHLSAGETLRIATDTGSDFTPDTIVAIYDNQGNRLAVDDDSGGFYQSLLEYNATSDGNYFIAVSQFPSFPIGEGDFAHGGPEYSPTGYWTGPGAYTLSLDFIA